MFTSPDCVVAVSDRDHVEAGLHLAPEVRSGKGRGGNDGVRQQSPAGKHSSRACRRPLPHLPAQTRGRRGVVFFATRRYVSAVVSK